MFRKLFGNNQAVTSPDADSKALDAALRQTRQVLGLDYALAEHTVREVFRITAGYPASLRHHHATDGGLFEHSFDVACKMIPAIRRQIHRENWRQYDLAAFLTGLTHDNGKAMLYKLLTDGYDWHPLLLTGKRPGWKVIGTNETEPGQHARYSAMIMYSLLHKDVLSRVPIQILGEMQQAVALHHSRQAGAGPLWMALRDADYQSGEQELTGVIGQEQGASEADSATQDDVGSIDTTGTSPEMIAGEVPFSPSASPVVVTPPQEVDVEDVSQAGPTLTVVTPLPVTSTPAATSPPTVVTQPQEEGGAEVPALPPIVMPPPRPSKPPLVTGDDLGYINRWLDCLAAKCLSKTKSLKDGFSENYSFYVFKQSGVMAIVNPNAFKSVNALFATKVGREMSDEVILLMLDRAGLIVGGGPGKEFQWLDLTFDGLVKSPRRLNVLCLSADKIFRPDEMKQFVGATAVSVSQGQKQPVQEEEE